MPYKFNPFTGELDLVADGSSMISEINADSGSATPTGGVINLLGGDGIITSAAGDTVTVSMITPVTVSNGGTGRTSAIEYSVICGGTTSGGAHQSVVNVGVAGQVLTSNGPGALPTWEDSAAGDVSGPASSTDENIAIFDGITGKVIKDGLVGLPINDGELIIGDTAGNAQVSTLTAGTGITITNAAGSITIDATSSGDVTGPASSVDENIAIFDGTTGKIIKDGLVGLPLNDGELIIGDTAGNAQVNTLTAGTGITITNGAGSISIAADNNGDVVGPASSVDSNIALFDGTTGKLIQDGLVGLPQNDGELIIGDTAGNAQVSTLTGGTGITITNGAGSITIDADNNGDVTAAANLTDFAVVCGDGGAKGVQTIASVGTTGQVLTSNGAGALPTFEDAAGGGGPLLKYWKASDFDALETNFAPLNQDDGTNASILVRSFDDTTEEYVNFSMPSPNAIDTSGTVTFRAYIYAATAAASVNIQLRLGHINANNNDSWDVAYTNEDSGDVSLSSTQDQITIAEWTETVTNLGWAADDLLLLRLSRIAPTGTNLTGDLKLIGFSVEVPQ